MTHVTRTVLLLLVITLVGCAPSTDVAFVVQPNSTARFDVSGDNAVTRLDNGGPATITCRVDSPLPGADFEEDVRSGMALSTMQGTVYVTIVNEQDESANIRVRVSKGDGFWLESGSTPE